MNTTEQLDLFADDSRDAEPALRLSAFATATRHQLDEHSWITHVHRLVDGDDALLRQLSALSGWEQRSRWMYDRNVLEPRLTNEIHELAAAPGFVVALTDALSKFCAVPYDSLWLNWYRDHHDSTSWHADRPANQPATAVVPVVSLGATRRFLIRPNAGGSSIAFTVAGGEAFVMQGRGQRVWVHRVPKQRAAAGARISLNFNSSTQVGA